MENKIFDIGIIGAGPAGLTAAIYGVRGGMSVIVFGGSAPGGQLLQTTEIENFPGSVNPISGFDLMDKIINQAKRLGAKILNEQVSNIEINYSPFIIKTPIKNYQVNTIIIATGASPRWLNIPGEEKYKNKGVSACATCDGFFYKDKDVCVIGGGDTAAEEALFLTKFARKVYLIHRRDKLRASAILQEKLKANPKIEIIYDNIPQEIIGTEKVNGIIIKNIKNGELKKIDLSGIFIAIGHIPNSDIFKGKIEIDEEGYIKVSSKQETSVNGIYAAGDVCDKIYRQAIVAAGSGCIAAMNAIKYLELKGK